MDNDAATLVTGAHDDRKGFMQQWLDSNESPPVNFAGTCAGERGVDREEGFASCFYSTCLREFQRLCRQEPKGYVHGSRSYLLKEELDKLYMWGESFGPGELDKALEESEELRDSVLDLLVNLGELLICELRASSTVAHAGQIHELESFIKQARLIMSDVDGQVDLDALASDATCLDSDEYSDDNVHDFCEDVVFVIKCLMELGPSLEQNLASAGRPAPSIPKSAFILFCLSGPAEFYVSVVREKFKQASRELVERLGEANWQRHLKVRNMFKDAENNPAKGQPTARSVFQPDMTFYDSGIGTSVPAGTQYAPSDTSFRTSNTEGALRSLRVPPTPLEASKGQSFRCYLCGDMISTVRTRTQWKMHVFSDLMPYICTFDGCPNKLRCFPSRSAWANHEFQEHRFDRHWACPECTRESCSTLDWEHHLNNVHSQKFSGPNLVSARNTACRIKPKRAEEEECPLCRVVLGKPRRAFVRHVSRHMEDIALMALPSNAEEDSEIGSISTNRISNEDNDTSKDVHIDEEYTIKCICGFKDDDGNTVYCERCDTWQHTVCYYFDENGVAPTKDILSSIDHFCADCKPRPLDARAAIKRQVNRRADISSNDGWYCGGCKHGPMVPGLDTHCNGCGNPRTQDATYVRLGFMGGLKHPDLVSKAGEETLSQECEEPTDEDEVESESGNDPDVLLPAAVPGLERGISPKDHHQYDPSSNDSTEAPHLETLNPIDPFVKRGSTGDGDLQVMGPQEPVKERRGRRGPLPPEKRKESAAVRKMGACNACRRLKRKCTHNPPKDSMSHGEHTKPLSTLKSPTVSVNSPLPENHQTAKSTSRPFDRFRSGNVSSGNIDEHDNEFQDHRCPDLNGLLDQSGVNGNGWYDWFGAFGPEAQNNLEVLEKLSNGRYPGLDDYGDGGYEILRERSSGVETKLGDYGKPPEPAKEVESEVAMVKGFTSQKDLDRHQRTVHAPRVACDNCPRLFTSQKDLDRHQRAVHADNALAPLVCQACSYETRRVDHFRRHQTKHEKEEEKKKREK